MQGMNCRPLFQKSVLWLSLLGVLSMCGNQSFSAETKALKTLPASATAAKQASSPLDIAKQKANAYAEQFKTWSQGQNQSFEPVLAQGHEATKAILDVANDLDDSTFDQFKEKMPGYLILRKDIVVVAPDAAFLTEQAKLHGQAQDVAFFQLMSETLNGYWPSTQEQLPDLSGCTRFGSHDLVRLYGAWKQFQQQYPKAYVSLLKEPGSLLLADIEDQLLNSKSACDSPDAVADEFETFIKTYPTSTLTPKIKQRLDALHQKKSGFAFFQGVKYVDPGDSDTENETEPEE